MLRLYLAWASLCLLVPTCAAQELDDLMDLTLDQLLSIEVSVASKSDERVADAPSSVTVFTQQEMRNLGIRSLQELLNYVPGFQSTLDVEQGRARRVSARGKSTALSESILFLIDGQRINDLYTGGISIINRALAFEHVKQVEVIRGPGSALYGSNAFMGVVNVVTSHSLNDAQLEIGSGNSRSAVINFSRDLGNVILSAFAKTHSDDGTNFGDVMDNFGRSGPTRDPGQGLDFYTSIKAGNFQFNFRHMERNLDDFITFGAIANKTNREAMKQSNVNVQFDRSIGKGKSLAFSLGYTEDQWDTLALLIPKDLELFPGFSLSENFVGGPYLKSDQLSGHLDFSWNHKKHLFMAGLSLERARHVEVANQMSHHPIFLEYQGDITIFDDDQTSFNRLETREITGLYLQDKIEISEKVSTTIGVRFDDYNDFGSSLNPRGAFIYKPNDQSTFKLMYGSAFRAPNFLELYDRNNPVDFGNSQLDAEKVRTTELAWNQQGKSFNSTLTWFHSTIEDTIVLGGPVDDPQNPLGAPSFYNGESVTIEGLEAELRATFSQKWILYGSLSHFTDDEVPFPQTFGALALNFSHENFQFNLNGIWRGENSAIPQQGSYVVANLKASYELNEALSIQVNIRNLGDEDYLTQSIAFPIGVPNRGMTHYLSLSYQH